MQTLHCVASHALKRPCKYLLPRLRRLPHLPIRLLHLLDLPHILIPLLQIRVIVQTQAAIRMTLDPWQEMQICGRHAAGQNRFTAGLGELRLDDAVAAVGLLDVAVLGVGVGGWVVVFEPVYLGELC